jgi:hypothetical protein
MKPTKALFINAKEQKFEEVTISSLQDLQKYVEGSIAHAPSEFGNQRLYVNEEGMINQIPYGFSIGSFGPYYGNGVMLGPVDHAGNETDVGVPVKVLEMVTGFYEMN